MAAQVLDLHSINRNNEVSREEVQEAIAKAVELRALHAALTQGNSPAPANLGFPTPPPAPHHSPQLSAHDYPVFTPSYEDEPLSGYHQIQSEPRTLSACWDDYFAFRGNGTDGYSSIMSDCKKVSASLRRNSLPSEFCTVDPPHLCPSEDQRSRRRNSLGDLRSLSSCNKCRPAILTREEANNPIKNSKNSNTVVPLTDSHASVQTQPKNRGLSLSRLFPRLVRKKHKDESSSNRTESEETSQVMLKGLGIESVEALKRELMEAKESRDAALMEAAGMRSSLGELKQKLEYLEGYCEELKKALRQAIQPNNGYPENQMPVSEEVMVEGFLQIVSEAGLSVKQFCKSLVWQIEESDFTLVENLNSLLQPHKLSLTTHRHSKAVLYHMEAIINQSLYQDFENSAFQKNGSPKHLDPEEDRRAQFSSFVALRNLSWNEVLRKGTKYYSEEFSKFCDQKMSCVIATLSWTRLWPEQLLQSFFVAAKCMWLLHLLAFSFNPPIGILRVEENRTFDGNYMEDVFVDRQQIRSQGPTRVKLMVTPGFYVQDRILRCKVLCRYKSMA